MKKLMALILVSLLVLCPTVVTASAAFDYGTAWEGETAPVVPETKTNLFTLDVTAPAEYLAGDTLDVIIKVKDIALKGLADLNGLAQFAFKLDYDETKVEAVTKQITSEENDKDGDFTSLISVNKSDSFECVGKLDEVNGVYDLAVGSISKARTFSIIANDELVFKISFVVKAGATGDIVFDIPADSVYGSNADQTKDFFPGKANSVTVAEYILKLQPDTMINLPATAIGLGYAGYLHQNGVSVILAGDNQTVSELTARGNNGASKDMNYFGVIVVDKDNVVTEVYYDLGREANAEGKTPGIKSDVVCPEGGYIIGVNANTPTDGDFEKLKTIEVGAKITLINVLTGDLDILEGNVALTKAGFIFKNPDHVQPDDLVTLPAGAITLDYAGYKHAIDTAVILAGKGMTIGDCVLRGDPEAVGSETPDMNYWFVIFVDGNGKVIQKEFTLGRPAGAKTDLKVPEGGYVIGVHGTDPTRKAAIQEVEIGDTITLYNVNASAVGGVSGNVALTQAGFTVTESIQPVELAELPADAITLDYAGYKHAVSAAVILAGDGKTIGDLVLQGDSVAIGSEAPDMNYWNVIVVGADGVVTGTYFTLGRPDGVKTDVECPAGGYIIGIHASDATRTEAFKAIAVGDAIELINVKASAIGALSGNQALVKAGFKVAGGAVVPADGSGLVYNEEAGIVTGLKNNVKASDFTKMFQGNIVLLTADGKSLEGDALVGTGAKIDLGGDKFVYIIVKGDIDGNGKIESKDYLMLKRNVLGTYKLEGAKLTAGDVNEKDGVKANDYLMLKRFVLGTYDIFKAA